MARPLRIEYEGAWYHIMNRGANHQSIFTQEKHRRLFLSLLAELNKKFRIQIHAYCLMGNHYHLLIQTPFPNLAKAMRHLDGVYTQKFNYMENKDGPLFRGRYKSILINVETHFLKVSRYIHQNPVAANICKNPNNYKWSSCQFFSTKENKPNWLNTDFTLDLYREVTQDASTYFRFVCEGIDVEISEFYSQASLAAILGDVNFIENSLKKFKENSNHKTDIRRTKKTLSIDSILNVVSTYFQIEIESIINSKQGKKNLPRKIVIYLASEFSQISHNNISLSLKNISRESIASHLCGFKKLMQSDAHLLQIVNELWDACNKLLICST